MFVCVCGSLFVSVGVCLCLWVLVYVSVSSGTCLCVCMCLWEQVKCLFAFPRVLLYAYVSCAYLCLCLHVHVYFFGYFSVFTYLCIALFMCVISRVKILGSIARPDREGCFPSEPITRFGTSMTAAFDRVTLQLPIMYCANREFLRLVCC